MPVSKHPYVHAPLPPRPIVPIPIVKTPVVPRSPLFPVSPKPEPKSEVDALASVCLHLHAFYSLFFAVFLT